VSDFADVIDDAGDVPAPHERLTWRPLRVDRELIESRLGTTGPLHFRRGGWGVRTYLRQAINEAMPQTAAACWRFAVERASARGGDFLDALEQQIGNMLATNHVHLMTCEIDGSVRLWWLLFAENNPGDVREHGDIILC
jgi:hypothetical protein